jgi:uncharacterized coiled-coil protein SlyX
MPSEQEVLENGMDVGKVNTVLVEKIEEMTLYAIDQEQKIESLNSHLANQQTKMDLLTEKINQLEKALLKVAQLKQ